MLKYGLVFCCGAVLSIFLLAVLIRLGEEPVSTPVPEVGLVQMLGLEGELGIPMGKPAVVEGEIMSGSDPQFQKEWANRQVFRIMRIDGKSQPGRYLLFTYDPRMTNTRLSGKVKVRCYETGGYEGVPFETYASDDPLPEGRKFRFVTSLVIFGQL
ncbi:MAG: hypothetical protein ACAI35_00325 [Candidatus Methylacidiphilales bacterium]|nr:hypothetical protein [Candidatus Methylacidiphilales bacterium]